MELKNAISDPIFKILSDSASELNLESYVIGGYVRDSLLGRYTKEVDIVAVGSGIELAKHINKKLNNKSKVIIYKNFGTAMIQAGEWRFEFVGARKESYKKNSRKPVVENGTFYEDLNRRDFTINTMAISLIPSSYGQLIDPFNGISDLKNKLIRTPLDPDITFSDDPLRMMRAIRFATQLDFTIDNDCISAIEKNKNRISIVSAERISDELNKIMSSNKPSIGFILMKQTGLLNIILPEISSLQGIEIIDGQAHKDNFYHTLKVLDKVAMQTNNLWLKWAALMHDIGKPATKKFEPGIGWTFHGHDLKGSKMLPAIFRRLKLPLDEKLKYVQKLVLLHQRPAALWDADITDSAIRRLLFDAGTAIDDLMLLCEADITSKDQNKVNKYLARFAEVRQKLKDIEEKDRLRNWKPPISGNVIMKTFNIGPGREVGIIKNAIKEAILEGIIQNNYEESFDFMIKEAQKIGLEPNKQNINNKT